MIPRLPHLAALACFAGLASIVRADEWTKSVSLQSTDGRTMQARIVDVSNEVVLVERSDAVMFEMPLSRLAPASIQVIRNYQTDTNAQRATREKELPGILAQLGEVNGFEAKMPSTNDALDLLVSRFTLRGKSVTDLPAWSRKLGDRFPGLTIIVGSTLSRPLADIEAKLGPCDATTVNAEAEITWKNYGRWSFGYRKDSQEVNCIMIKPELPSNTTPSAGSSKAKAQ